MGLLTEFRLLLVIFLLPLTATIIVVVLAVLVGSSLGEVVAALSVVVALVVTLASLVAVAVVLLHLGLTLDLLFHFSINQWDINRLSNNLVSVLDVIRLANLHGSHLLE